MLAFCPLISQGFNGFSGPEELRPSFDYVRAGDLVRVRLFLDAQFGGAPPVGTFRTSIGLRSMRVVQIDQSGLSSFINGYSGPLIVEVQPLVDFARLDDLVRLVAGTGQQSGLKVLISGTRGEFVSKVETTAGQLPSTIPAPSAPGSPPAPLGDSLGGFFQGLTSSPVTLAVTLTAVVLLVIAAKK